MSEAELTFLRALGLDEHADERAVRRAYAQRLKRIDQAAEPEAFQALRTDYETALRWLAWKARQERAPEPATDASRAGPDAAVAGGGAATRATDDRAEGASAADEAPASQTAPDPMAAARSEAEAVFVGFLEADQAVFTNEAAAREALDRALSEDRLVNLEARTFFECRVAMLLMDGWRPGHEFLFGPACEVFHWSEDRRHLELFGALGAAVDAAINQKLMFWRQAPQDFERQRGLVRRLRDRTEPSARALVNDLPLLEVMAQRFPHWLHVVTSRDNLARWRELHAAMAPEQRAQVNADVEGRGGPDSGPLFRPPPAYDPRKGSSSSSSFLVWLLLMAVMAVVKLAGGSGSSSYTPPPSSRSDQWPPAYVEPSGPLSPVPRTAAPQIVDFGIPADTPSRDRRAATASVDRLQKEARAVVERQPAERPAGAQPSTRTDPVPPPARGGDPAGPGARLHVPDPMEVPGLPSTLPSRPSYDLLRTPDGAASVPRLGG